MKEVPDRVVVVETFFDPNQAQIARVRLEAEGVRASLDGDNHIAMNWFMSNAIGGVKLLVHERDLERARQILDVGAPEILDEQPEEDTANDTATDTRNECCPACHSHDISREPLKRRLVLLSILLLGIPIPFFSRKMLCQSCGHRWIAT